MKKLIVLFVALMIYGCAISKKENNIERYDTSYYLKIISQSSNLKSIKTFLGENNLKIRELTIFDNKPNGTFSSIWIDNKRMSYATPAFGTWAAKNFNGLIINELGSYFIPSKDIEKYKPLRNGKYLNMIVCGDLTHAEIALNNETLTLPVTYMLSAISKDNAQLTGSQSKLWDCDGYEFGDVIYKKSITVISVLNSTRLIPEFKNKENVISNDEDKFGLIVAEALDKAGLEIINDVEMLQALKDYLITMNNSKEVKEEVKVKEEIRQVVKQESTELKELDDAKNNCKDLGFKLGSKEFGNCVLKLAK